jgi:hypothetical protein
LVTLKDEAGLRPNFSLPNTRLVFDIVRPAMPVPDSAECCGLLLALSSSVSVALCNPSAPGVKVTGTVQVVLGATVIGIDPQVPAPLTTYSAGSETVALEMTNEWVAPVLSTVKFFVAEWPKATLPKAREAVTDTVVVGVAVGVAVIVGTAVAVAVLVAVAVDVAVLVAVAVAVFVGVEVVVAVRVAVLVTVGVGVDVPVAVAVAVLVAVAVGELVAVGVAVLVGVAVGEGDPSVPNAITLAE